MHIVELLILAGIVLALFGPKTLQSLARGAGKGVSQAKQLKDELTSGLPMDDIANVKNNLSRVPLSPQQAVQKLITSEGKKILSPSEGAATPTQAVAESVPAPTPAHEKPAAE
ncbi:MAG TPA: twin-arginine translocase TatA/TatE family subunit [Ktedonobacteraceae bacterium]|nr:twin-arginine translocase TatA/TatE family subunit [Ktedonobacteraceae bacterium]